MHELHAEMTAHHTLQVRLLNQREQRSTLSDPSHGEADLNISTEKKTKAEG